MVRETIRILLEHQGISVSGEAADGRRAVDLIIDLQPDVALLHAHLPLLNGFDVARKVRMRNSGTRVLLLSFQPSVRSLSEIISSGVAAYLSTARNPDELPGILETVCQGAIYVHSGSELHAQAKPPATCPKNDVLSLREREVLQLICEGKGSKEIATIVGISTKTAESYRHRIVTKLGVRPVSGLVRYAIRTGMIQAVIVLMLVCWHALPKAKVQGSAPAKVKSVFEASSLVEYNVTTWESKLSSPMMKPCFAPGSGCFYRIQDWWS